MSPYLCYIFVSYACNTFSFINYFYICFPSLKLLLFLAENCLLFSYTPYEVSCGDTQRRSPTVSVNFDWHGTVCLLTSIFIELFLKIHISFLSLTSTFY